MVEKARRIALEVAALHAEDVDQKARFPVETMDALRKERMLSAFIPRELGGLGCSFTELHQICYQLGQRCAASAMVFAMHQIQVGCLVRHGMTSAPLRSYLSEVSEKQLLLASATSEVGIVMPVATPASASATAVARLACGPRYASNSIASGSRPVPMICNGL